MKTRLNGAVLSVGVALLLLTSCVSSRKYKTSQAELAKVRSDSAQQAQQIASLNGNVSDLQNKNNTLQQSLDASNSRTAATQKNLDYYQGYFKDQQSALSQVSDDVKGALTQAGIANGDVQMVNNTVYVRLDEDELFKRNSMVVSANGKKALDNLAGVIKARQNVNVFVGAGDSAAGTMASTGNMSGADNTADMNPTPVHHRRPHHVTSNSGAGTATASGAAAANSTAATDKNTGAPVHKKIHHHTSEGSLAIYNGPGRVNRSWALKQGRMVTVANHFLKNGVEKVNVSLQQSNMNGTPDKTIKVIFTPKMEGFNPPAYSSK